jgi:16S rRNA processing protein RimM
VDWTSMVTVGRITRPHGNRGHVVVLPDSDFAAERFREGEVLRIFRAGEVQPLTVTAGRQQGDRWIVGFDGFDSIDAAETLRGLELKVPAGTLRALEPGSFYVHDLLGCEVRTVEGDRVGTVVRVDLGTGVPMLAVDGGGEVLVPFVDAICRRVDAERRVIEIDPPEGLIALNRKQT